MFASLRQKSKKGEYVDRTIESMILIGTQESSGRGNRPVSDSENSDQKEAKPIKIDVRDFIYSVAFLDDGKHLVSGGQEGKIRRWRVESGQEVGTPMDAGSPVLSIAVSESDRVQSSQRSGACSRRLAAWGDNRDRTG